MAINPLQPPVNYMAMMPQVNIGQGFAELGQALAQRKERQQAEELRQQYATDLQNAINNPTQATWAQMIAKYPKQREAFGDAAKMYGQERIDNEFKLGSRISTALENNAPEVAMAELKTALEGYKTSGVPAGTFKQVHDFLEAGNLQGAQAATNFALSSLDPERFKKMAEANAKVQEERRTAESAPAKLRQELAKADKEEAEARVKMETATDDIAKAKASRELEQAKAKKEQVQADTELQTRLSDIGFKQAQINKFRVETRNLDTEGKMLSLDFQAALQGLPLPSKKTEGGGTATEDERKAAGWLAQATNAYNNMLGAMYTKEGKTTGAEKPGVIESALGTLPFIGEGSAAFARSTSRQKFMQASSSLSEALLRAATGAGVNKDEAKQKLEELTPLFTDDEDTRKQKLAAIPVYLDSLKTRAGRAAPSGYQVPQHPTNPLAITLPDGTVFTAPNQKALDEFKRRAGL